MSRSPPRSLWTVFHDPGSHLHHWFADLVAALVMLSIALFVLEVSVPVPEPYTTWLATIDRVLLWFFVAEISLRILTFRPPALDFFRRGIVGRIFAQLTGRLRFAFSPFVIVDILAVLAVYPALRSLRALRLLRLIGSLHLFRYHSPLQGVAQAFRDNRLLYAFAFSCLGFSVLVGGLSIYLIEREVNPGINTMADGFWWALVTITTVGYGDLTPATGLARVVGSLLMVGGLFMLALFAGVVGNTLLNAVLTIREEQFRMSGYVNHVVVCGYDQGTRMLLDMLLEQLADRQQEIVVFSPGERPEHLRPEFIWVSGDPTKESELDKVRMSHAESAIACGSRAVSPQRADADTILTVFTLRRYFKEREITGQRTRPLHIVCEILDRENVEHAHAAGADEVIETTRLGFSLVAHAVAEPGTATVASQMLALGTQNVFVGSLPPGSPTRFGEIASWLKKEHKALLVGIRRPDGEEAVNPLDGTPVDRADRLMYLAEAPILARATRSVDP